MTIKRLTGTLVAVALMLGLSACDSSDPKGKPKGMSAQDLAESSLFTDLENLKEENYDMKIREATLLITQGNPMNGMMYWSRGIIYVLKGDNDMARDDFIRAWQEDPKQVPILMKALDLYLARARTVNPQSKLVKAFSNFTFNEEKANVQMSKDTTANGHYERGKKYLLENDVLSAIREFSKAIELDPGFSNAYSERGGVLLKTLHLFEAEQDLNKAIELNPKNAQAYLYRGVLFMLKDKDAARQNLDKAVELDPALADLASKIRKALEE